ncbi:MAG: HU family DNA-binding protein [Anaerolineales bacterium]|nr:HU family DNA-binding protein [Anaerolineales bacterium]
MACVHNVIQQYRPELDLEDPVEGDDVVAQVAESTELDEETVRKVFDALPHLLYDHLIEGHPVEVPGVGQIRPTIDLDGTIRGALDSEEELVERLSEDGAYRAGINRQENIGVSLQRLAQMWNSSHPDDKVRDVDAYAIVKS